MAGGMEGAVGATASPSAAGDYPGSRQHLRAVADRAAFPSFAFPLPSPRCPRALPVAGRSPAPPRSSAAPLRCLPLAVLGARRCWRACGATGGRAPAGGLGRQGGTERAGHRLWRDGRCRAPTEQFSFLIPAPTAERCRNPSEGLRGSHLGTIPPSINVLHLLNFICLILTARVLLFVASIHG